MKATSKLRPPHPSAERPLQGVRGSFICKLPAYRHYIIKCSIFLRFYAVLKSAQKCALLRAKALRVALGTSGNHQKADLKANAYITKSWKHSAEHTISLNTHSTYMYIHVLPTRKYTEKSHLELSVLVKFSKAGRLAQPNTTDSTGKRCRSWWHPLPLLTLAAPTPLQTYI